MTSERWERTRRIFEAALEQPAERREAFVRETCGEDTSLAAEVLGLLAAHDDEANAIRTSVGLEAATDSAEAEQIAGLNTALDGRYSVERVLGEGGMAVVYLARDVRHDRYVAIKVLKPELAAVVGADRFLSEIRTTARLRHPHILALHDSGEAAGQLFYVTPYVEGESLKERIDRDQQLPIDEAVSIVQDVASALQAAHDAGVIHRDIKPANILLGAGGPMVADFGISLAVSDVEGTRLTETGLTIGSAHYMSPEQASGERTPGPASDIYSLGCVLYEMLTGEPPYSGRTAQAILAKILTGERTAARALRPSIPEHIDRAVDRCLGPVPADRFASAAELATALSEAPTTSSTSSMSLSAPLRAAAAAVAVLGLAGLAWWGVTTQRGGDPSHTGAVISEAVPTIDVRPFVARGGAEGLDGFGLMMADVLRSGLTRLGNLSVVHSDAGDDAPSTLRVQGSFLAVGDRVSVSTEIVRSETGELVDALPPFEGSSDSVAALADRVRDRVLTAVLARFDNTVGPFPERPGHVPTLAAFQAYSDGDRAFVANRWSEAIARFDEAHRLDPDYLLPQLRVAPAFWNNSQPSSADSVLELLKPRLDELAPHELAYHTMVGSWLRADHNTSLESARRITRLTTGSRIDYDVGIVLLRLNRARESVEQLESLDPSKGALAGWVSYWGVYAQALHLLGDHTKELEAGLRAMEQYPTSLATLGYAVRAAAALGDTSTVATLTARMGTLRFGPTTRWTPGSVFRVAGEEFAVHGFEEAADRAFREGEEWYAGHLRRNPGDERARIDWLRLRYESGNFAGADEVLAEFEDDHSVQIIGYRMLVAQRLGRHRDASELADRLRAWDDPYSAGIHLHWLARLAALEGDDVEAISLLRAGYASGQGHDWGRAHLRANVHRTVDLTSLRERPDFIDLMRPIG